jgi:hypothetical protein
VVFQREAIWVLSSPIAFNPTSGKEIKIIAEEAVINCLPFLYVF